MAFDEVAIDWQLAATLRGEDAAATQRLLAGRDPAVVVERINYHGLAGLLRDTPEAMAGWPAAVARRVSDEAVGQAMWELRHRQILNALLADLAAAQVVAVLLKGTAVAYDVYAAPSARARGDSDLLIHSSNLDATRGILGRRGFEPADHDNGHSDPFALQEVWTQTGDDGMDHHIDLHWHVLNSPALDDVLPVAECLAHRIALPRLGPNAMGMDRVRTLIHTCIHRMLNFASPYFVDERTYYGGDRLIWLRDIDLLARALSDAEWDAFVRLAREKGVAAACLDGLLTTRRFLATPLPAGARVALDAASTASRPAAYLRARQFGRAWRDLQAVRGVRRKVSYLRTRTLPSAAFVRDKYPRHAGLPLPFLYARRLFDLVRARPTQGAGR